eukprot:6265056-Alexandrium_andersonii.AAC.1
MKDRLLKAKKVADMIGALPASWALKGALMSTKCLPLGLYGAESVPLPMHWVRSLSAAIKRALTGGVPSVASHILALIGFGRRMPDISATVLVRRAKMFRQQWHATAH